MGKTLKEIKRLAKLGMATGVIQEMLYSLGMSYKQADEIIAVWYRGYPQEWFDQSPISEVSS